MWVEKGGGGGEEGSRNICQSYWYDANVCPNPTILLVANVQFPHITKFVSKRKKFARIVFTVATT